MVRRPTGSRATVAPDTFDYQALKAYYYIHYLRHRSVLSYRLENHVCDAAPCGVVTGMG